MFCLCRREPTAEETNRVNDRFSSSSRTQAQGANGGGNGEYGKIAQSTPKRNCSDARQHKARK